MSLRSVIVVSCFIAFDILTGLIGAIKSGTYKSTKMREGLFHKLGEYFAVAFAYGCEYSFPYVGITVNIPICTSVVVYIVIMETGSIVENIGIISPDLKKILGKTFGDYKNDAEPEEKGKHEKH